MDPIPLTCDCGKVQLHIAARSRPPQGNRVICHCNACRAFARVLGRADILDAGDGTEILQVRCDRLAIARGAEHIAALRLSPKGLARWYAACCTTPLGNTGPGPKYPFFGAITHTIADKDRLGPLKARVNIPKGKVLPEGLPPAQGSTFAAVAVMGRIILGGWLKGAQKHHPLFPGGEPLAEPCVITLEEKAAAYA
ncbi:DUF6151 family protein [Vannielia litorea]|uniref:CENP-V/GFA domain-containing protein n=1 Tax=Vannielia litorea TaxID=1217970 RepID=A0A1N6ESF5_9RHOB|nr:DUF6151 family protein [Vannielia litorea]SIN85881.1 hypothetical protein SAMN05444002_1053 [Vannielia litorea]